MSKSVLERIIGSWPDPSEDASLLAALGSGARTTSECADEFLRRADLQRQPLGDLLLGLQGLPGAGPTGLPTRCRNVLGRYGIDSWAAIADLTPEKISSFQNFGAGSFRILMAHIVRDWALAHRTGSVERESASQTSFDRSDGAGFAATQRNASPAPPEAPDPFSPLADGVLDALHWVWREQGARTLREAIRLWSSSAPPEPLATIVNKALNLDLGPLIGVEEASEASWRALLDFDGRTLAVLAHRRFLEPRLTLEELGARFDVTRERIRQLEVRGLDRLEQRWEEDAQCAPLRHLAATTRRTIGPIAAPDEVTAALTAAVLATSNSAESVEVRRGVLRAFLGARVHIDDLSLTEAAAETLRQSRAVVDQMDTGSVVSVEWLDSLMTTLGADDRFRPQIQGYLRLRRLDEGYLPWGGSLNEKAVAVLTVRGETMSMMELHEVIGFEANPRSLTNAVQSDPRIMRRGRDRYGLRSWGGEEYSGILEELEQAVGRSPNGRVVLSEIIPFFVEEFGVSESSVRAYADDWRFVRDSDGTLRLRGDSDPDPTYRHQAPEDTPGLFLLDGAWHLRVAVDGELLRGSGRLTRIGVVLVAGLEPGLIVGFEYEGGAVTFSWRGRQPAIGSLRGIAVTHACAEGDLLFIPIEGPEPRRSRIARVANFARATNLERLALEVGLTDGDGVDETAPGPVARVLGLPSGADWHDVVDRLRDRGERSLIELVPTEWL